MLRRSLFLFIVGCIVCGWCVEFAEAKDAKSTKSSEQSADPRAPIEDTPGLPRVLLIGDSISLGYTLDVRRLLAGKANVHRPNANCGSTRTGKEHLGEWLGDSKWDVIHFNWGLWDINRRINGKRNLDGEIALSPEEYEQNLEQLMLQLKKTGAKLIWASTTYVQGGFGRRPGDEIKYNKIAKALADKHGIEMDDLHALSATFPIYGTSESGPELFKSKGNVHFTPAGSLKLAEQVAATVEAALKSPAK